MAKIKNSLKGERIILKTIKPTIELASLIFKTVDENRKHLQPWLPWVKYTGEIEDSLKYLFEKSKAMEGGKEFQYVIFLNKEYIGSIGIFNINLAKKSAEIGYWLSSKFSKKGYMTEAVRTLEKEYFENFSLNRIQIRCDDKNKASIGVARKCGYKPEGVLREEDYNEYFEKFRNTLIFSKLKSEYKKSKK